MTEANITGRRFVRKPISKRDRFSVLSRGGFRCAYCGISAREAKIEIDHVVPVSKGGGNELSNLVVACRDCNAGKAADEPLDFQEKARWMIHGWLYDFDRSSVTSPDRFLALVRNFVSGADAASIENDMGYRS